jgi:hypothetical protein
LSDLGAYFTVLISFETDTWDERSVDLAVVSWSPVVEIDAIFHLSEFIAQRASIDPLLTPLCWLW